MDIIDEAVKISLKNMDGQPEVWLNLKEEGATKFIAKKKPWNLRDSISIEKYEVPLYEYYSNDCYSLITSIRVISRRDKNYYEAELKNILKIERFLYKHSHNEPWKTLMIIDDFGNKFLVDFGEDYPCYFAKILILNLSHQMRFGRWAT